ncbi:ribosome assembly RNA-binding protein YhbY [Reinekea marina]|uniref:Ribosome assembly RNA-binding protein YhbY n=1 Tax=Reinekea marina TaxID=1310421 RepID=A0ABV7WLD1_9GAMM|nr:ribosome assembly RNA-binding protein YhbY [Reinekea marina]MBU2865037.1 ribosome assembly RNA-binding protein YhbY [Reinekea forsetii]MDN3648339.1 ribosome assembly RNA-binding protein YhbY [Reinekea marina]
MKLTQDQKKRFRTIGHQLNPVVTVADKGLSESVMTEIERALNDHELIKVKIVAEDRDDKKAIIEAITGQCGAILVQQIGHIALILKKAKEPNPKLSNISRFSHL